MPSKRKPRKPSLRGFKPAGQSEARHRIDSMLKQAQLDLRLQGVESRRYLHTNADGSIDAELSVLSQRGKTTKELYQDVGEILPAQMPGLWISAGARFSASKNEEHYFRYKGLQQVETYYRRYHKAAKELVLITMHASGREKGIALRTEKSQRKKMESAFVRFHWNQTDAKPGRGETRGDKSSFSRDRKEYSRKRRRKRKDIDE